MGQLPFFAEYFNATGLFADWIEGCPLSYVSPNAPKLIDVLGKCMLSILHGHNRYAHVGVLRGDGVAPSILGMKKIIGEDSLRRALSAIAPAPAPDKKHTAQERTARQAQVERSTKWMQSNLMHNVAEALKTRATSSRAGGTGPSGQPSLCCADGARLEGSKARLHQMKGANQPARRPWP